VRGGVARSRQRAAPLQRKEEAGKEEAAGAHHDGVEEAEEERKKENEARVYIYSRNCEDKTNSFTDVVHMLRTLVGTQFTCFTGTKVQILTHTAHARGPPNDFGC
jgi:hypothetical protein